ncbi:MAG: HDIG domain-containing metalloprotein [Candidatus Flexifilum sp.]
MLRLARFNRPVFAKTETDLRLGLAVVGVAAFVLAAAGIVAFDSLVLTHTAADLEPGDIVPVDILAPISLTYVSDVLTEQRRSEAVASVSPVYDPPDPTVARQQVQTLRQILDYIDGVRLDPYGAPWQKRADLDAITALTLDPAIIEAMLNMSVETWRAVDDEATIVLERVMRESIRDIDLPLVLVTLPTQVSVRFDAAAAAVVVALVEDLIRPNRQQNPRATDQARMVAAQSVAPETRTFEQGQIVVRAGTRIDAADYEALARLGLLQSDDQRAARVMQALLASIFVVTAVGLYFSAVDSPLKKNPPLIAIIAAIVLIMLSGARLFSLDSSLNPLYPTAALGLVVVVLTRIDIALVVTTGSALLIGLMFNNSLESAVMVAGGGLFGALALQRTARINRFFYAGGVIALVNCLIVGIFFFNSSARQEASVLLALGLINGMVAAMTALAVIYVITLIFNLPTNLKLVELSQPSQRLLQRLLREAPGTYQHSLQVANLAEQAANAIGAHAELVRVAALYHDIGKVQNPAFFVENQIEGQNPHDALNDPYRSADIIISHVVDGDRLARQYRLPARVRDFILEHHGTTVVSFFYNRAVLLAGDPETVDTAAFTYPGPKPQSRETAVLMLADSCESTVRARKPANRQEIEEIVEQMIDTRMREGQLDESNLTLNDIETIREIFVDMLQAMFHPRINYPALVAAPGHGQRQMAPLRPAASVPTANEDLVRGRAPASAAPMPAGLSVENRNGGLIDTDAHRQASARPVKQEPEVRANASQITGIHKRVQPVPRADLPDDAPLPEVPPLPRPSKGRSSATGEQRASNPGEESGPRPDREGDSVS